jgi:hypothetical protein
MLVRLTKFLCLSMLILGSMSLRSLHSIAHSNAAGHANFASINQSHAANEHAHIALNIAENDSSNNPLHDCDHDEPTSHNPATETDCDTCDDLALASVDAGILLEPLVLKRANHAFEIGHAERPCAIKSPKVALANPPPTI